MLAKIAGKQTLNGCKEEEMPHLLISQFSACLLIIIYSNCFRKKMSNASAYKKKERKKRKIDRKKTTVTRVKHHWQLSEQCQRCVNTFANQIGMELIGIEWIDSTTFLLATIHF